MRKTRVKFDKSPVREKIESLAPLNVDEFDLDKVVEWNNEVVRKYKYYVRRFKNS